MSIKSPEEGIIGSDQELKKDPTFNFIIILGQKFRHNHLFKNLKVNVCNVPRVLDS